MTANIRVIAELGDGICIAEVPIDELREQDLNARVMDDAKFRQLVQNIKRRGTLEQLPYCAETNRGIEIVSGHHRVRASRKAGLTTVTVLLDRSGLSRSAIAAKQIAHNSIEGVDDEDVLKKIAAIITDVDEMLETALGEEYFAKVEREAAKMPLPKVVFDWKSIQFTFLPFQLDDLNELVEKVPSAGFEGIAGMDQFEGMVEAIKRTQKFEDVKNVGAAIHLMVERALDRYPDDDRDYDTVASVFGRGVIPHEEAERIKQLIRDLKSEGVIENPWEVFGVMAGKLGE